MDNRTSFTDTFKEGIHNPESVERIFKDDVADKKRTASGAFHMNRNKNLFAESKPKPEPVFTWKREPMTWKEFKAMPATAQNGYLDFLVKEHNANATLIANMLGVHQNTVNKYAQRSAFLFPARTVYNIKENKKIRKNFEDWVNSFRPKITPEEPKKEPKEKKTGETEPKKEAQKTMSLSQAKGKTAVALEIPGVISLNITIEGA